MATIVNHAMRFRRSKPMPAMNKSGGPAMAMSAAIALAFFVP